MFRKIIMFLIACAFVLGIGRLSFAMNCGGHSDAKAASDTTSKEAVNAGNKICPVSGEKIGEGMEPVTYEYEGKIYNFCCAMCIDEFKKDPEKYIEKVEEELKIQAEAE